MNKKEKELVKIEENSYNICEGGKGGFGYINKNIDLTERNRKISSNRSYKEPKFLESVRTKGRPGHPSYWKGKPGTFRGKHHSTESKIKIGLKNSLHQKGKGNSQFGSFWITNGIENRKCKNIDDIPKGFKKGRVMKIRGELT